MAKINSNLDITQIEFTEDGHLWVWSGKYDKNLVPSYLYIELIDGKLELTITECDVPVVIKRMK